MVHIIVTAKMLYLPKVLWSLVLIVSLALFFTIAWAFGYNSPHKYLI